MNILGVYCGIGSMLHAAEQVGYTVLGNIEPRSFEPGTTFKANFPSAYFNKTFKEIEDFKGRVGVLVGHPSCGAYSSINWRASKIKRTEVNDFVNAIKTIRPLFFIMDNLEKVFIEYDADFWASELGETYNITPRYITNRNYGNAQVRKRVYIIGSLREFDYIPVPNETKLEVTTKDVIGHILGKEGTIENHNDVDRDDLWSIMTNVRGPNLRSSYQDMYSFVQAWPEGKVFKYYKANGTIGSRIGLTKIPWNGKCATLTGGGNHVHPIRCTPFTVKEHLLLMGYDDSFVIKGMNIGGNNNIKSKGHIFQKTAKGVCIQSIQHFLKHIIYFVRNKEMESSGKEKNNSNYMNVFNLNFCGKSFQGSKDRCALCKVRSTCGRRII